MEHLLNQIITIQSFSQLDENGDKSFGNSVTVKARVVIGDILIMQPTGENRMVRGRVQVMGDVVIKRNDKITYNGLTFEVEKVEYKVNGAGETLFKFVELAD
jgi:hypothetical protein